MTRVWPLSYSDLFPRRSLEDVKSLFDQLLQAAFIHGAACLDPILCAQKRAAYSAGKMGTMRIGGDAFEPGKKHGEDEGFRIR
jgi:hypothetical protein